MKNSSEEKKDIEQFYVLQDFYRKKNGSYMIVGKIPGSERSVFKLPATTMVSKRRDLLSQFNLDDKINIIGLATTETPPVIVCQKTSHSRYFPLLAMLFGCALITSNIASSKLMSIFGATLTGGTLPYLLTYVLGTIITESYGYKRTRQLIWGAVACNLFAVLFITLSIMMPSSPFWIHQREYSFILGSVPRIVLASLIGYSFGEFLNAYVIAKFKIFCKNNIQGLRKSNIEWLRIGGGVVLSSIVAMTVDNFLFLFIAYFNTMPFHEMINLSGRSYFIGLIFQWSCIPLIVYVSEKLKSNEKVDIFDINTNFTPFSLDVQYDSQDDKQSQ